MSTTGIQKAYDILKDYNGNNNQIQYYKYVWLKKNVSLEDFAVSYILRNHDYQKREINKIVGISSDFGKYIQEKDNIEFRPEKLLVLSIIGEMNDSYHCYVKYRQSMEPKLMYVNKKYILHQFETVDYSKVEIDFSKYDEKTKHLDRKLKEHQKDAIRFMLANRKCILADSMGLGKSSDCVVSALEGGFEKVLIITTASLKSTWKRELLLYTDESEISIVNGSEWDGSKRFTIVNYDIMQNFHEVPMEPMYEWVTSYDEYGLPVRQKQPVMVKGKNGEMVQKMKKTNNKDKVFECLSNSPLFQNNFSCVIIDEAQKLSNNKSIRYRVVEDFLKRAKPECIFLVTGTPLTNRPMNLFYILKLIDADITKNYDYYVQRYCGGKKMRLKTGKTIMLANGATNLEELREKIKHVYIRRLHSDIPGMVNKQRLTKYYDLSVHQMSEYDKIWGDYVAAQESIGNDNSEEYRQLVEGMLVRQYLAKEMTKNTIELADDIIDNGEKVVIICTFQEEIELIKKHYKGKAVVYDGKMTVKAKDKAEYEFMNNPKIKVFIGQIIACSVGLTLTVANKMIFNSYSWVAADNLQAEDRIYRITQKNDATCIYQLFTDSISQDMFEKVMTKEMIMNETIKAEKDK